jgi:hypothetical protein
MADRSMTYARLGAASYFVWGLLHLGAAYSVYQLGLTVPPSEVQGRVFQDAWDLFFFAVTAMAVAAALNRRNHAWGYWINLAVVSVADIGFILFVLMPGHVPLWRGILGPIFWILGAVLTTVAYASRRRES